MIINNNFIFWYAGISLFLIMILCCYINISNSKLCKIETYYNLKLIQDEIESTTSDLNNLTKLKKLQNELFKYFDIFKRQNINRIQLEYYSEVVDEKIQKIQNSNEYIRSINLKILLK
jgi:hypothetical protein